MCVCVWMCVCLTFLIFYKHLEGREFGTLLFHRPHHSQHGAQGGTALNRPLATHGLGLACQLQGPAHCLTRHISFHENRSQTGPGPWGTGAASCPLLLGGQHKVPTQTDQAEKEARCECSPATVVFFNSEDGD